MDPSILVKPIRKQFVSHGHRVLREQALQPPIAPIHQHQWILGHTWWRIRVLMDSNRLAGRRRSLHAIGTLLERVRRGCWEWTMLLLLLLMCAVVGLLRRAGVNHCGPPPPALTISKRLLLLMPSAIVRLPCGLSDILWGCAQRAVGLERLL